MYNYEKEKPTLFTDEGQRYFLKVRDRVNKLLDEAGAARMQEIMRVAVGTNWLMLACVDRMVELGEVHEVTDDTVAGQHRVFVRGGR